MPFSARTSWDTRESAWAAALAERRRRGLPVFDLTAANPTKCGFDYPPDLLAVLSSSASLQYEPDARGLRAAREAVQEYYRDRAEAVNTGQATELHLQPEQIFLTTSTSEAYSFLFRLVCDPGDEVLIAQPGYPLFDYLAALDNVHLRGYPLFYDHGWHLDLHGLRQQLTPRTRAIVVVHPNNPTGHFTTSGDRMALEQLCRENGLALIVDEVFLDYSLREERASFAAGPHPALTFVLSGLSKVAGLPQMKLAWLAAFGPQNLLVPALERLEVIADTFLSLSAPLQHALLAWLRSRVQIQQQIRMRVAANLQRLDEVLEKNELVERLQVEGGWYVIVRLPAIRSGEDAALALMKIAGIAVHPGSFFGMDGDGYFVLSLLTRSDIFEHGVQALLTNAGESGK